MSGVDIDLEAAIQAILQDRPIAYHPVLARALKSVTAGILLSQFLYWTPRVADGWFYKTRQDITDETALSRYEQEAARRVLVAAGVLDEELRGMPAKMHFHIRIVRVTELLTVAAAGDAEPADMLGENQPTGLLVGSLVGGRVTNKSVSLPPTRKQQSDQPVGHSTANNSIKQRLHRDHEQRPQTENDTPVAPSRGRAQHAEKNATDDDSDAPPENGQSPYRTTRRRRDAEPPVDDPKTIGQAVRRVRIGGLSPPEVANDFDIPLDVLLAELSKDAVKGGAA